MVDKDRLTVILFFTLCFLGIFLALVGGFELWGLSDVVKPVLKDIGHIALLIALIMFVFGVIVSSIFLILLISVSIIVRIPWLFGYKKPLNYYLKLRKHLAFDLDFQEFKRRHPKTGTTLNVLFIIFQIVSIFGRSSSYRSGGSSFSGGGGSFGGGGASGKW